MRASSAIEEPLAIIVLIADFVVVVGLGLLLQGRVNLFPRVCATLWPAGMMSMSPDIG
jgi:hypothetical protein